jgi:hypothetical protein
VGHPEFLIVGAMKAGTTSLFSWLGSQPEIYVPSVKEPNFFNDERIWSKGEGWYRGLFAETGPDQISGEASVGYTAPSGAAVSAPRIASVLPDARIVFLVRDPIERLRSHYRHEVLRGRERRSFEEALADRRSPYVERSCYFKCFEPFTLLFRRERIAIVRSEELYGPREEAWHDVLAFLGLGARPRPATQLNVSEERPQFSPAMRALWDAGLRRPPSFVPAVVRRALRPLLLRRSPDPLLRTAGGSVPAEIVATLEDDAARFKAWLGATSTEPISGGT